MIVLKKRYDKLMSERNLVRSRLNESKVNLDGYRARRVDIDVVQQIIQTAATQVQNNYGAYIGHVVTKAIHHVFPERANDMFVVRFRENRGQTECQMILRTESGKEQHPFHCSGGGVWDVISLALRCVIMELEKPQCSRFMMCDEPFKYIHGHDQRIAALRMLHNTCKKMAMQCVIVHQSDKQGSDDAILRELSADGAHVYRVSLVSYQNSKVERVV